MGARSLLMDFCQTSSGHILGDASAALGIIRRHGLGRLRHVDCAYLWIQEKAASKELSFNKVRGESNPADCQTKHVPFELLHRHMGLVNCDFHIGINEFGLKLNSTERSQNSIEYSPGKRNVDRDMEKLGVVHNGSREVKERLLRLIDSTGRPDSLIWSRHDLASRCFRSTNKTGPECGQATARVTVEAATGKIIEAAKVEDIVREKQHGTLPSGKSDIVTYLVYSPDRWKARG